MNYCDSREETVKKEEDFSTISMIFMSFLTVTSVFLYFSKIYRDGYLY